MDDQDLDRPSPGRTTTPPAARTSVSASGGAAHSQSRRRFARALLPRLGPGGAGRLARRRVQRRPARRRRSRRGSPASTTRSCGATPRPPPRPGARPARPGAPRRPGRTSRPACRSRAPPPRPRSGTAWPGSAPRGAARRAGARGAHPPRAAAAPGRRHERGQDVAAGGVRLEHAARVACAASTSRSSSCAYRSLRSAVEQLELARASPVVTSRCQQSLRPRARRGSGSSAAFARSSSSSTSVSRTAPSSSPSHLSSSRSASSHSGTSSGRNVRRSERSRRVATRAWCTPSGSSPSRTPGSWREQPDDRGGDRAPDDVAGAVGARPRSATATSGGAGRAARGRGRSSASGRARRRPRPRSRATSGRPARPARPRAISTSSSRNRGAMRPAVEHRHLVVDDLGDRLAAPRRELDPAPARLQARDACDRRGADPGAHEVDGGRRAACRGVAGEGVLPRTSSVAAASPAGSFTRPALGVAVPEAGAQRARAGGRRCRSRRRRLEDPAGRGVDALGDVGRARAAGTRGGASLTSARASAVRPSRGRPLRSASSLAERRLRVDARARSGPSPTPRRCAAPTRARRRPGSTSRISSSRALQRPGRRPASTASTRRSRLRGIRSAEPMRYSAVVGLGAEAVDARVLEEPADDRAHADRLRQPGHARAQAADPADDEVDLTAGVRRVVERVDHLGVDEAVHLHHDAAARRRARPRARCARRCRAAG